MSKKLVATAVAALGVADRARHGVGRADAHDGVGSNPNAIVVSAGQAGAYVANDGSVSVINTNNHTQLSETSTTVHRARPRSASSAAAPRSTSVTSP